MGPIGQKSKYFYIEILLYKTEFTESVFCMTSARNLAELIQRNSTG